MACLLTSETSLFHGSMVQEDDVIHAIVIIQVSHETEAC
jgi:hypothetical protein